MGCRLLGKQVPLGIWTLTDPADAGRPRGRAPCSPGSTSQQGSGHNFTAVSREPAWGWHEHGQAPRSPEELPWALTPLCLQGEAWRSLPEPK